MLRLLDVTINVQNFGTILGVFLSGDDVVNVQRRYYSFYNHGATRGELEWWSPLTALFWVNSSKRRSAEYKFRNALTNAALFEILNQRDTEESKPVVSRPIKYNPWPEACRIATERYDAIEWVTWFVTGAQNLDIYSVGETVSAERGTGNFNDDVLTATITSGQQVLGMSGRQGLGLNCYINDSAELDDEQSPENDPGEGIQLEALSEADN